MRQLNLFSALQSSTEGIDTEVKLARGGAAAWQAGEGLSTVTIRPRMNFKEQR